MGSSSAEDVVVVRTEGYASGVLKRLNQYRLERKFTDAILCVGHEEFPCHRSVLALSSPYFDAMFSSDLQEGKESRVTYDPGVSPWVMKRIIEYAYSGAIEIGPDNAQDYLRTGHLLDYPAIVEASAAALGRHLHASNCVGARELARLYGCNELEARARQYVLDNFAAVIECDEFVDATPCDALLDYLASDALEVSSEEVAALAAVRWVGGDAEHRRVHLRELLGCVRLAAMDGSALERLLNEPLVRSQPECAELVRHVLHGRLLPGRLMSSLPVVAAQRPRPSTLAKDVIVVIGGVSGCAVQTCAFEPLRQRWQRLPEVPTAVSWASATIADSDGIVTATIYVMGGIVDNLLTDQVWRLCPKARAWRAAPSLLMPRARHAAAQCGRRLFIVGGLAQCGLTVVPAEEVEAFDLTSEQWSRVGQSSAPRQLSCLIACGRTLYEVGGVCAAGHHVGTMETYSVEEMSDGGSVKHPGMHFVLPVVNVATAGYARAVLLDGTFYVLWESSRQMIALTPEKWLFRALPSCAYARLHCAMTAVNGLIYVLGGLIDEKPSSVVECYDPATAQWTVLHMQEDRACHACVSVKMFSL